MGQGRDQKEEEEEGELPPLFFPATHVRRKACALILTWAWGKNEEEEEEEED